MQAFGLGAQQFENIWTGPVRSILDPRSCRAPHPCFTRSARTRCFIITTTLNELCTLQLDHDTPTASHKSPNVNPRRGRSRGAHLLK